MNTVLAYTFPDCKKDGVEFRFTGTPTCIKVSADWIAACAEDFSIKVTKRDESSEPFELKGHEWPVICIDLSKTGLLASKAGDGKLKVWQLEDRTVVHSIDNLDQCKSFDTAKTFASVMFDPRSGKQLAYCDGSRVIVLETNTWNQIYTLTDPDLSGQLTVCAFSPDGILLAVGTSVGEINVWNTVTKKVIDGEVKGTERNAITAIAWNPDQKKYRGELSMCDSSGQIDIITDIVEAGTASRSAKNETVPKKTNVDTKKAKERKQTIRSETDDDEGVNDIYDDLGLMDNEAEDDDDGGRTDYGGDNRSIFDNDDDGVSLERLKNDTLKLNGSVLDGDDNSSVRSKREASPSVRDIPRVVALQPPFQPGSTPVSLEHRFMVWNHLGIVRSHNTDNEDSIDVEFHDATFHHGIHINNHLKHTMASLSDAALALACDTPSKLVCITFKTSGSREWSVSMPDTEEILCVCTSSKLVAVATDTRYLRIFSVIGTQREVIAIPGPVVTVAAHQEQVMVAYHAGASATEDQNIHLMILDCFGYNVKCKEIRIPLTPNSKLTWLGYSEAGSPVIYDSFGVLKLYRHKSNCWFPIWSATDHTVGASDHFFVIHVEESMMELHAIHCRGSTYPVTLPRPIMNVYKLELPLCDPETDKTKAEAALLSSALLNITDCARVMKENAIKLFALACKMEQESRARELLEMLANPEIVPLAAKYASGLGRIHLVSKLSDMMPSVEQKEREVKEKLNEPEPEMIPRTNRLTNPLLNFTPSSTTPVIAPAPMSKIKAGSRNPFKKNFTTGTNASNIKNNNLLSHLTDMTPTYSSHGIDTPQNNSLDASIERKLETKSEMPFINWLELNKEQLKREFSDLDGKEFQFACMRKYKTCKEQHKAEKRKLEEDPPVSSVSKLTKFAKTN